jgi:anti-sigma-K factor RskA
MSETDRSGSTDPMLALLYASGELDGPAAAAFEERLADDQAARDALCDAVRLQRAMTGHGELLPDPAYRDRVIHRLRPGGWRKVLDLRSKPTRWALGAAAAAALLLALRLSYRPGDQGAPAGAANQAHRSAVGQQDANDCDNEGLDLAGGQHLARAVDEEYRRKSRASDRRIVRGGSQDSTLQGPDL